MKPAVTLFVPGIIWLAVTFALLMLPGTDLPQSDFFELIYFDKWVHTGLFGVLTFLWAYPFFKNDFACPRVFIQVALIVTFYGIVMEYVQKYFAAFRGFDYTDMIADAAGAFAFAFYLTKKWKNKAKEA